MPGFETSRRIVVVDDDRAILSLVDTRLTLAGYTVFTAHNGREALARLTGSQPAALVLDLNMPELDGFGVLEQMGKEMTSRIPTLVLTASRGAGDVQRAIQLGARDYLAKPFKDNDLLLRVSRLFRRPSERQSLDQVFAAVEQMLD